MVETEGKFLQEQARVRLGRWETLCRAENLAGRPVCTGTPGSGARLARLVLTVVIFYNRGRNQGGPGL